MNINEVKELVELINSSELSYFEFKSGDSLLRMDKSLTRGLNNTENTILKNEKVKENVIKENIIENVIKEEEVISKSEEVKEIKGEVEGTIVASPMVGTFYASPSPDSSNFVSVGDTVKSGDILCIIEAMKLMNEIESEITGTIVEILVKDGDMVEYGTPLFKIKEGA